MLKGYQKWISKCWNLIHSTSRTKKWGNLASKDWNFIIAHYNWKLDAKRNMNDWGDARHQSSKWMYERHPKR